MYLHSIQVNCIELAMPIVEELKKLEESGVVVYDAFLQREVLAISPILCVICDNPRASEIVNHLGPGSKMFCRMCMVSNQYALSLYAIYLAKIIVYIG